MSFERIGDGIGYLVAAAIRFWIRLTGKRVEKDGSRWLNCPIGPQGRIGAEIYQLVAEREDLQLRRSPGAGLLVDFDSLKGDGFDPATIRPEIRDFYEHTSCYQLEAWSEAALVSRLFLWLLVTLVSNRMNQLNFPVSSLELAGGMTSEVLPFFKRATETRIYTGWLRRLVGSGRIIYAGFYCVEQPANYHRPCVKVSFPLPFGSSTVFLRPEAEPDGSFKLISAGNSFGEPGFYRMVETSPDTWRVRYLKTLREHFHVYIDKQGSLRTEHTVHFLGLLVLRLHYKMVRVAGSENDLTRSTTRENLQQV